VRMAQSLGDEQAALNVASPGLGLAQALLAQMRGGVATQALDPQAHPPEAAASRLPGLRSRVGEGRREVADSITALIDLLSRGRVTEKVSSAIRGAPGHIREFVDRMAPAAEYASAQSGVPAKLILSQAALESGWGRREILRPDGSTSHNLFGIKSTGWKGRSVQTVTTEYEGGRKLHKHASFRAYDSYEEAFEDYARMLSTNPRYTKALSTARNAEQFAQGLQRAGYATDPHYARKLSATIRHAMRVVI